MGNWAINPLAFEPAKDDVDGISLFREDFVTKEYLASVNTHPKGVRVARLIASDCIGLHLSLNPSPDPTVPPGHAVIPDMPFLKRTPQTKLQIQEIKDSAQKLAQIASKNRIYAPPGLADPTTSLRH